MNVPYPAVDWRSPKTRHLFVRSIALLVMLMTLAVSITLAAPLRQPHNPECQNPATVTIIVLDATSDGRFVRADENGSPLSRPFGSTEVWITGNLEGQVTVQVSPLAANLLKGNDTLSFLNRTRNQLCINLDLTPAIHELSSDVTITETLLQLGDSQARPILIDLSSFNTLTISDETFDNQAVTAQEVTDAILSREGEPISFCDSITTDLEGEALRAALNAISTANHHPITYSEVREALRDVDRDPNNLDNVILIYTNRSQDRFSFESDDTVIELNERWNREHLWPQSHGAGEHPTPKADLHHIFAADKTVNSSRSNEDFSEVDEIPENEVRDGPNNAVVVDTFDDETFWEPRDEIKGDIARALFYMDIRYEGSIGEPDLMLVRGNSPDTNGQTRLGDLAALLQWNTQDPVSAEEIARNARVVEVQGNINPFIACAAQIDVTHIWN
jgi:endonuclease I